MLIDKKKALGMSALAVGVALVATGQPALGQTETATAQNNLQANATPVLPELTVASHYVGVPYNQSGTSVSVIDPQTLEERGIENLTDALASTPGVYLGATGQYGSTTYIAVRGLSTAGGVTTVIDGMRVSDSFNAVGLGNIGSGPEDVIAGASLFNMGTVELVKGSQGAVYGGNSYGGVLSMDTPEGQGAPSYRLFSEAGSFGSYTGYAQAQGKVKKLGYFVGVGYETTQNDMRFEGNIYPYNPTGTHSTYQQWQEALRLTYDVNDKVKVNATYRRQDSRYKEPASLLDEYYSPIGIADYKTEMRSNLVTASIDAELSKVWTTSFMVGYYDRHTSFDWPEPNAWYDYSKFQTEWRNALTWNKHWKTVAGMAWDRSEFSADSAYTEIDFIENNLAWFAEQIWTPTDYLSFSLAGRLEHSTTWNNNATWRFTGSWGVQGTKDASTRLIGSVGSGFRAPTEWERYADYYSYVGNPDLNISRSLGGDFGIEQRVAKNNYVSLTGFWTRINNNIEVDYNSYPYTWQNESYAVVTGVEAQARGEIATSWKTGYTVNYTYVMPRDNDGKQLSGTARHTVNAEIHTSPTDRLTVGAGMLAGLNRTDTYGAKPMDDYVTFRLFARYRVSDNVTLHCRLENLFDERYTVTKSSNVSSPDYSTVSMLGRGFGIFGGVTVDF
jgi:iron complex outermembrane receptor protein